ncbi:Peptidyl-glycine alpha-amidating monooxygenase [Hypsibius exemplaris]|uniref:Peptidyl-glycine alpha-amidating monooxygenase n=1 Tax=Hypsibius exemplaris TaxID=2072580 RepID=A0A1W0WGZ1_HYPEX|nr:Peptidyl-glycine alpha-amidating monooxygenase [Hypsibius exemplaris]
MELRIFLIALSVAAAVFDVGQCERNAMKDDENSDEEDVIAMWMPFINATTEDEYHCMGVDVAWDSRYITKYVPHASQKSVHHILIYGCSNRITKESSSGAWKCLNDHPIQAACGGASKFLYAWAKDAPALELPADVGFHIGTQTAVKGIFIQVHYSTLVQNDNSGISLILSSKPRKYAAGIMLLAGGGQYIPPHEPVVNVNVICKYQEDVVLHPFGYRTHATQPWSSHFRLAFYKMDAAHNITTGTIFGARCVYNSTERETVTLMGPTHNDEMCNFYMMYYADRATNSGGCTDVSADLMGYRLPDSASEPLPADQIVGHHHHAHAESPTEPPAMGVPEDAVTSLPGQFRSATVPRRRPDLETELESSNGRGRDGELDANSIEVDKKNDDHPGMDEHHEHAGAEHPKQPTVIVGERNKYGYEEVEHWSDEFKKMKLGQISGIALDHEAKSVYIFHRRDHTWDGTAFGYDNVYAKKADGPITQSTILVVDKATAAVQRQFGENLFYMPHGITVGRDGDLWVTDVALHQVIRLKNGQPTMILGAQFEPGHDGRHFCKPTSVTILSSGEFYVGDGYCNSRIIKFTPDGRYISHFGTDAGAASVFGSITPSATAFSLPHDIKLSDDESVLFVADRENGRVMAYQTADSKFLSKYQVPEFGFRVFSIDVAGDVLVAVNGPSGVPGESPPVQGILVNVTTGTAIGIFNSKVTPMQSPHAVAYTADQSCIFVVELNGNILQFHRIGAAPLSSSDNSHKHLPHSGKESDASATPSFLDRLSSNPLTPPEGGFSYLLLGIFVAPVLLLCCGLGFCCLRKTRTRTSQSKWKDALYQYRGSAKGGPNDLKLSGGFKSSREGFRPLRQEEKFDDDSDSDEEENEEHQESVNIQPFVALPERDLPGPRITTTNVTEVTVDVAAAVEEVDPTKITLFLDQIRPIDFLLVYEVKKEEGDGGNKLDLAQRDNFFREMEMLGVETEKTKAIQKSGHSTYFVKLHLPWDVVKDWAEKFHMRVPLQEAPGELINWSHKALEFLGFGIAKMNPMQQIVPFLPKHYYTAQFRLYTAWLIPISIVGVFAFLYGYFSIPDDPVVEDICASGTKYNMCPVCDRCPYWKLEQACPAKKLGYMFDNVGTCINAFLLSLWAVLFVESWKRKNAQLIYFFDCDDYQEEDEHPRAEFARAAPKIRRNAVTGLLEPFFPPTLLMLRRLASWIASLSFVSIQIQ